MGNGQSRRLQSELNQLRTKHSNTCRAFRTMENLLAAHERDAENSSNRIKSLEELNCRYLTSEQDLQNRLRRAEADRNRYKSRLRQNQKTVDRLSRDLEAVTAHLQYVTPPPGRCRDSGRKTMHVVRDRRGKLVPVVLDASDSAEETMYQLDFSIEEEERTRVVENQRRFRKGEVKPASHLEAAESSEDESGVEPGTPETKAATPASSAATETVDESKGKEVAVENEDATPANEPVQ